MEYLQNPEWQRLVDRYVKPDRRYLRLGGNYLRGTGPERARVTRELGEAAAEITPRELGVLLDSGWRERKTTAWLIAVARRTEFRERLGELLLASGGPYAGSAYCVTLATFGTAADAELLVSYLDHYLRRPDLYYDQPAAIGALLHLDGVLGTDRAAPFVAPDGLWQRWIEGPPRKEHHHTPDVYRQHLAACLAFVDECAAPGPARKV